MKKILKILASLMAFVIVAASFPAMAFAAESNDTWETMAPMNQKRAYFQTVVVNNKIYAIGGFYQNHCYNTIEEYNPQTDQWTLKSPMKFSHSYFQAVVLNDKIYVMGGQTSGKTIANVEEYDPKTDKWTQKKSMNNSRSQFQAEILDGKIYAIGGYQNAKGDGSGRQLSSVEEYDPDTDTWTNKAPMNRLRANFGSAVINGKIYAISGTTPCYVTTNGYDSTIEEYSPKTNKWVIKSNLSKGRHDFQTQTLNGKIYIIGGNHYQITKTKNTTNYSAPSLNVEVYDPASNTCVEKAVMQDNHAGCVTFNNHIYAMGGNTNSMEEYDPVTDIWAQRASIAKEHCSCFCTSILNGELYVVGGAYTDIVEKYNPGSTSPTLTATASSNQVNVGQKFTTEIAVHHGTNLCAEDIRITYDPDLFEYEGAQAEDGMKIYKEDQSASGTLRFIVACEGKENAATGDKDLFHLIFKAKKAGSGKIDIVKGRIADNSTLEEDVEEENCGEDTVTVEDAKDVNKSGEYTLLDLGIDAWYDGMNTSDTDTTNFNPDVIADGIIDDKDLSEITQQILLNSNYEPNEY